MCNFIEKYFLKIGMYVSKIKITDKYKLEKKGKQNV